MRALVTGAGGFLGIALVRLLAESGYAVRALVRTEGQTESLGHLAIEWVRGDVTVPDSLPAAVANCDVVFHLAGIRRASARDEFLKVNAEGTRHLIEACLRHSPSLRRFVLAGSLAASGPSASGRREEDPLSPVEWYGESKAEAERIALGFPGRLKAAVARPPRITGPGDRENLVLFRLLSRRILIALSGPPRPLSFIDVEDCARGMLLLAERDEAIGNSFFLAHEERTDLEALQREVARVLSVQPVRVRLEPFMVRFAGAAADAAGRLLRRPLPLSRKMAAQLLAVGWTCRTERAARILGFKARIGLPESIRRSADWYRERGWL